MSDEPVSEQGSRWGRWLRANRLTASITLGLGIGLVWGITTGVGLSVLIGYGVVGACEVVVPAGLVIGSVVGVGIYKGARSVTWSGSPLG